MTNEPSGKIVEIARASVLGLAAHPRSAAPELPWPEHTNVCADTTAQPTLRFEKLQPSYERLTEAGADRSAGSKGDDHDNALAKTIDGLHEAEPIHRCARWKTKKTVELAWVAWFNNHRLLEPLGDLPPAEAEANDHRHRASQAATVAA